VALAPMLRFPADASVTKFYRREARYQPARKNRRRVTVTPLSLDLSAHFTAVSSSCSNRAKRNDGVCGPAFAKDSP
jgi:hypothetical protein